MNLLALETYVRERYPNDLSDTALDEHINEAYRDLARLFTPDTRELDATLSTANGKAEYTLGRDSRRIIAVYAGTGISRVRLRTIRQEALAYPRSSGAPLRWYPAGMIQSASDVRQAFGLDPVPTAVQGLTVEYEPEPTALSDDGDVPRYVPEEHHHLICWGALSLAAGKSQDYNVAQNWDVRYRAGFNELAELMGRTARSNFPEATKAAKGGGQA